MTEDDVNLLWLYVAERWSNFKFPDDPDPGAVEALLAMRMTAWLDVFADLDPIDVRAAFVALGTGDWPPALGLVRTKALEIATVASGGTRVPDFDEAWAEVTQGMRRYGRRQRPMFTHPLTTEVVKAIGWVAICSSENGDVIRGQFRQAFDRARARLLEDQHPAPAVAAALAQHALPSAGHARLATGRHDQG